LLPAAAFDRCGLTPRRPSASHPQLSRHLGTAFRSPNSGCLFPGHLCRINVSGLLLRLPYRCHLQARSTPNSLPRPGCPARGSNLPALLTFRSDEHPTSTRLSPPRRLWCCQPGPLAAPSVRSPVRRNPFRDRDEEKSKRDFITLRDAPPATMRALAGLPTDGLSSGASGASGEPSCFSGLPTC
jgi:hypothetical protein